MFVHVVDWHTNLGGTMRIELTKNEIEIIQHRLEAPDCIAEATELSQGFVQDVVEKFEDQMHDGYVESGDIDEGRVLEDCITGSTFMPGVEQGLEWGEISRQKAQAYRRACDTLENKTGWSIPRE